MLFTFQFTAVDVDCYKHVGETYRGIVNVTIEGLECRLWKGYHESILGLPPIGNHNFCRNLRSIQGYLEAGGPWCFTADEEHTRWDYCNITKCLPKYHPDRERKNSNECDRYLRSIRGIFHVYFKFFLGIFQVYFMYITGTS